jgi:hypothetical protein
VIELHHNALSTCSQKVSLVFAEKAVSFELRETLRAPRETART